MIQSLTLFPSDYDPPWQEALERFFPQFLEFFFPTIYAQIDWSQGWELLDKELQQIMREAEIGLRLVDKLVKVWSRSGEETWIAIHAEVQGQYESRFPERMFVYHYRIRDRFNRPVVSLALLTDDRPQWRPNRYSADLWGCRVSLEFPIVKLLDYRSRWSELEASSNPFAVVVMAHLQAQATRQDPEARLAWKLRLVKGLYERGYSQDEILELFRLIDWMMALAPELEQQFDNEMKIFEEDRRMRYVTSIERRAAAKAAEQATQTAILQVLKLRFGPISDRITEQITQIQDPETLEFVLQQATLAESFEVFEQNFPS